MGTNLMKALVVMVAAAAVPTIGEANLLVNGDFADSSNGWVSELGNPANTWAEVSNDGLQAKAGTDYYARLSTTNWGGWANWHQNVPATAGGTYTLTADAATQDWWNPEGKLALAFYDSTNAIIGGQIERVTSDYVANLPWTSYSVSAVAPAGTASVTAFLKFYGGGAVGFDNAVLVVPEPATMTVLVAGGLLALTRRRHD